MRHFSNLTYLFILLSLTLSLNVAAPAQTNETARRVVIQYYFLSADKDVTISAGAIMERAAFEKMLRAVKDKKAKKLHVWATGSKEINLGGNFSSKTGEPYKTEESEVVEINTSDYGETGKVVGLAINAHKGRWNGKQLYTLWEVNTSATMPINSVLILGGQDGDPRMGKPAKKKLKPQLLYVAVSVHTID